MRSVPRGARRVRAALARAALAATAALGAAAACTEVTTNPDVPVAIQLSPPPLPSLVAGDSMRDSAGQAVPLQAEVFNFRNEVIPGAGVQFLALDTTGVITVDPASGFVVAHDTGQVTVVATAGSLQSAPITIIAVERPGAMRALDSLRDSLDYAFTGRDTVRSMRVRLFALAGADTIAVRSYLVRYRFAYPAGLDNSDSTTLQLVDAGGHASLVDTTDASGVANRSLRITPQTKPFADSVVVEAAAAEPDGSAVPGSPVRYVIRVHVQ